MTQAYPLGLQTILALDKSRSQPAAFRISEPRRGAGYSQLVGTDTPVFWDVAFLFSSQDAIRFQLWFKNSISRGADEFTMPIRTEFGVLEHTCRFLPDSVLDTTQKGPFWYYKATIMARAQVIPEEYDEASDIIVAFPDWEEYASWLDIAANENWPEVA